VATRIASAVLVSKALRSADMQDEPGLDEPGLTVTS
jgi:hypothetical protein